MEYNKYETTLLSMVRDGVSPDKAMETLIKAGDGYAGVIYYGPEWLERHGLKFRDVSVYFPNYFHCMDAQFKPNENLVLHHDPSAYDIYGDAYRLSLLYDKDFGDVLEKVPASLFYEWQTDLCGFKEVLRKQGKKYPDYLPFVQRFGKYLHTELSEKYKDIYCRDKIAELYESFVKEFGPDIVPEITNFCEEYWHDRLGDSIAECYTPASSEG